MLMEQKVVLDEKSFKALSAESRVNILKSLGERRRTLSELSHKLSLGNSTVKEHCDILANAELIKQIDEGRKWKYYELTGKGKQIIVPSFLQEARIMIMLCLGALVIGGIIFIMLQGMLGATGAQYFAGDQAASPLLNDSSTKAATGAGEVLDATAAAVTPAPEEIRFVMQGISLEAFTISVLAALVAGIIIGWLFMRRR